MNATLFERDIDSVTDIDLAAKLDEKADNLQASIDAKRRDRLENTPKRAREGMSARIDANNLERAQQALRALAAGWRSGTIPQILRKLKAVSQVAPLVRHGIVSNSYYHVSSNDTYSDTSPLGVAMQSFVNQWLSQNSEHGQRSAAQKRADLLREKLNDAKLCGIEGYFPTPIDVASQMLELSDIGPNMTVLEPSAGTGDLAWAILGAEPTVELTCIEVRPRFVEIMQLRFAEEKHVAIMQRDFLDQVWGCTRWVTESKLEPGGFDRIIMNPPFERGQDCEHVMHAYQHLAPGGRLVSVMSAGAVTGGNGIRGKFADWLGSIDHEIVDLPAESFRSSGTLASTALIVINKPD